MINRVRRLLLTAALACLAVFAVPAIAAGGNRVAGNCTKSQVRPSSITITCADDYTYVAHIQWTLFGGATASGSGQFYSNPCKPNCAASKEQVKPVTFTLSQAKACPGGVEDYRQMAISFPDGPPNLAFGAHYYPRLYCPIP